MSLRLIPCKFPQADLTLFLANSGLRSTDRVLIRAEDAHLFRLDTPAEAIDSSGTFQTYFDPAHQFPKTAKLGVVFGCPIESAPSGVEIPPDHIAIAPAEGT